MFFTIHGMCFCQITPSPMTNSIVSWLYSYPFSVIFTLPNGTSQKHTDTQKKRDSKNEGLWKDDCPFHVELSLGDSKFPNWFCWDAALGDAATSYPICASQIRLDHLRKERGA